MESGEYVVVGRKCEMRKKKKEERPWAEIQSAFASDGGCEAAEAPGGRRGEAADVAAAAADGASFRPKNGARRQNAAALLF